MKRHDSQEHGTFTVFFFSARTERSRKAGRGEYSSFFPPLPLFLIRKEHLKGNEASQYCRISVFHKYEVLQRWVCIRLALFEHKIYGNVCRKKVDDVLDIELQFRRVLPYFDAGGRRGLVRSSFVHFDNLPNEMGLRFFP